jgi:hypothetical protein
MLVAEKVPTSMLVAEKVPTSMLVAAKVPTSMLVAEMVVQVLHYMSSSYRFDSQLVVDLH